MYDEKILQGIGNKIKLLRTLHKISQQELSQQLGVSQTHLCNIENGRVVVNLRLLMRAANLLSVSWMTSSAVLFQTKRKGLQKLLQEATVPKKYACF